MIQDLSGKLEHWPARNQSSSTETHFIDKMLVVKRGLISPNVPMRAVKQTYVDFGDSVGKIRTHDNGRVSESVLHNRISHGAFAWRSPIVSGRGLHGRLAGD